jgi:LacI family transcriptional regulator
MDEHTIANGDAMTKASKRPVLNDVAAAAGVSVATASKALNGRQHVNEATRQRVLQAAEQLNFTPNPFAQALNFPVTGTIGVLTADLSSRFVLPILMGVEEAFGAGSTSVIISDARNDRVREQFILQTLIAKRVDGIIVLGADANPRQSISQDVPIPVVYAYTPSDLETDCSYTPDNAMGARLAINHLVARGRRNIAMLNGEPRYDAAVERGKTAMETLQSHGLELATGEVLYGDWSERWGRQGAQALLKSGLPVDGIFCGSDQIARGVVDELRSSGVSVPHDVGVVGFDNWELFATTSQPPLTTVDMNLEDMGRAVAEELQDAIAGKPRPGIHRLPVQLIPRESTASLARGAGYSAA